MKPFDLQSALAGEPVALRNGDKGFVLKQLEKPLSAGTVLIGYVSGEDNWEYQCAWSKTGRAYSSLEETQFDIVGMWEEPQKYIIVNGHKITGFLTEDDWEDGKYYYVCYGCDDFVDYDNFYTDGWFDNNMIKNKLVFREREDAIKMANALLDYAISQGETSLDD